MTDSPLLAVENLQTKFTRDGAVVVPVDGVSLRIGAGETVGIVGESGSGKSMTALSIMGLIDPPGRIAAGRVLFNGTDLLQLDAREAQSLRGSAMSMIFQDPMTFLNPIMTVGAQVGEVIRLHRGLRRKALLGATVEALRKARVPAPEKVAGLFPHQLSGGMRQRVLIAIAIACAPDLVIADEPTTALDVTIQAQILQILKSVVRENRTALLLITHDLGVVADICDRVYVMYAGRIVEEGLTIDLFARPRHPYTQGLLRAVRSVPRRDEEHATIEGHVPDLRHLPSGCRFHPRCPFVMPICREADPPMETREGDAAPAACWLVASEAAT
jgi:oligopeptide/dipeptide ABC transporter ATP-binding protein